MAMGDFGFAEEGVERLHKLMILPVHKLMILLACQCMFFRAFARRCALAVVFEARGDYE
jgi:hypothetical protein